MNETSALPNGVQFLDSDSADFEKLIWSFRLADCDHVSAGRFAILPYESFTKLIGRLRDAERLLRALRSALPGTQDQERVDRFFDPEPL